MVARFAAALRRAGIRADPAAQVAFVRALRGDPSLGPFGLYWYARLTLVSAPEDFVTFDRVFALFWQGAIDIVPAPEVETRDAPASVGAAQAPDRNESTERAFGASSRERLADLDFAEFTEAEWRLAERLMHEVPVPQERRRTRRVAIRARGRYLDLRATLREESRSFGLRLRPRYRVRRTALRPLVFLCDVSGSMAPYGRALLQYAYVVAGARRRVAVCTFSTRLTDLTLQFARRPQRRSFAATLMTVADWGGGTLIGASLHAFNENLALRQAARGATVLIVSDGCERNDPAVVGREMRRLARAARRVVWINPRKSDPAYEPLVQGMAAALPALDAFLPGHSLRSLDAIAGAIRAAHMAAG